MSRPRPHGPRSSGLLILLVGGLVMTSSPAAAGDDLLPADKPVHEVVDHYIAARLESKEIKPAPAASDAEVIRRLTLDLAGRIPTAAEARAYVNSDDAEKRTKLVDRLLNSADFAWHQRNELDRMLLPEDRNNGQWREYLLWAVRQNRPWDEMFRDMMAVRDDAPEPVAEGASVFLASRADSLDDMTNDTSTLFFGVAVNCAKCHDHPLVSDWKQKHYYGFASFFNRTFKTKKGTLAEEYTGTLDFKTTAGEEKQADFMFLTGAVVDEPETDLSKQKLKELQEIVKRSKKKKDAPEPPEPEFSPREEFVKIALTDGEKRFFARNIVNRTWARFMGHGLVHPLDQMHSLNWPSHEELLEWLTRDLIAHDYNLKHLIRGIVSSQAYARSSRWSGEGERPAPETYAVFQPRPLTPRQYALSLMLAASSPETLPEDTMAEEWAKQREKLEKSAGGVARNFEMPGEKFQVSVDEALLLTNDQDVRNRFLRDSGDKLVGFLKEHKDKPKTLIEAAVWNVLTRPPQAHEVEAFKQYLAKREDRLVAGIRQVVWALLTSPELRFNY